MAYLQGSQVRPPGQSSSVRMSHSKGEQTQERALATATENTTMPPSNSNEALIFHFSAAGFFSIFYLVCLLGRARSWTQFKNVASWIANLVHRETIRHDEHLSSGMSIAHLSTFFYRSQTMTNFLFFFFTLRKDQVSFYKIRYSHRLCHYEFF